MSTGPTAATISTAPSVPLKRRKTTHEEKQEQGKVQMLEQQIQLLREENARLQEANEVSQERAEELERSLAKSDKNETIEESMQAQLKPEELEPRARELLLELVEQAEMVKNWDESETWFQKLQLALTECPSIAKAAVFRTNRVESKTFLLADACAQIERFYRPVDAASNISLPYLAVFQLLVKACPSALLWVYGEPLDSQFESSRCIDKIAGGLNVHQYDLLLWLADEYEWIFNLSESLDFPAHTYLLRDFHSSDLTALHSFFQKQPNSLRVRVRAPSHDDLAHDHVHYEYPINIVLRHYSVATDLGAALISFMASSFPESLGMQDHYEETPMHHACRSLVRSLDSSATKNGSLVLAILAKKYPQAAFLANSDGENPIEYLISEQRYNTLTIKNRERYQPELLHSVILLLRAYFPRELTSSMCESEFTCRSYSQSYSLLEEEARFCRLCIRLKSCSKIIEKFAQLAGPSDNSSGLETDEDDNDNGPHVIHQIYSLWASKHIAAITTKFESEVAGLKKELAAQRRA